MLQQSSMTLDTLLLPLFHKWGGGLQFVNTMHAGTLDVGLIQ